MAAPIPFRTEEEQRAVIRFLWAEGVQGEEIHRRLSAQYGNSADRFCGLVVRVPGYRSRGSGSIPRATKFSVK
jgi:hypothetical protein